MRTTLDIADDVLLAAAKRAEAEGRTVGDVLTDLARQGLAASNAVASGQGFLGFRPLAARGVPVTNDQIDAIRDGLGGE